MNIKVYSRVRPLNRKQVDSNCRNCVETKGPITRIFENDDPEAYREFVFNGTFDQSSHQKQIYEQIGIQIMENALNGYHCCLLAYGQTGTGKSYTLMGSDHENQQEGVIPRTCRGLFKKIQNNTNKDMKYQITFSRLYIYNEKLTDLCVSKITDHPQNIKIRQNKQTGVYVEDLTKIRVNSYKQLSEEIRRSSTNKSIWETYMSCLSSRAHTITTIQLKQIQTLQEVTREKLSIIHFGDLAGSERLQKTGNAGDRLKQSVFIGKSLSNLGRVIAALADNSRGKQKKVVVPYRDSCITRILQNALGGYCMTTMICTISPSEANYEQTLSTLRYGYMMHRVQNKIKINEIEINHQEKQIEKVEKVKETKCQNNLSIEGRNSEIQISNKINYKIKQEENDKVLFN